MGSVSLIKEISTYHFYLPWGKDNHRSFELITEYEDNKKICSVIIENRLGEMVKLNPLTYIGTRHRLNNYLPKEPLDIIDKFFNHHR